jgi:hypothetical protein
MLLLNHRGREHAIKIIDVIRDLENIDFGPDPERQVKKIVMRLRTVARLPVAATKEPPYGYFIPVTAEEVADMRERMFREGLKLIVQSRDLFGEDKRLVRELEGQLRLAS